VNGMSVIWKLRIIAAVFFYAVYLVLSVAVAGQLAYLFAREQMAIAAYLFLFLLFAFGTAMFAIGMFRFLRKAEKEEV